MKIVRALPLFAMGTLTLGLVGATVLAPVVSAESSTFTQKVSVDVTSHLGLNVDNPQGGGSGAGDVVSNGNGESETKFKISNNLANGFTATVTDNDDNTSLLLNGTDTANAIPAVDDALNQTKPGWSIKNKAGKFVAIPPRHNSTPVTVEYTDKPGDVEYDGRFSFKTDSTVQAGTYSDVILYTVTPNLAPSTNHQ